MIVAPSVKQGGTTALHSSPASTLEIRTFEGSALARHLPRLEAYVARAGHIPLSRHPAWLVVLERGLRHIPYCLEAVEGETTRGFLPLAYVRSHLFGRYLVSLPYLNYGGPLAADAIAASALIDRAVELADRLGVRHLELRHERAFDHPALVQQMSEKVNMRLSLPADAATLWDALDTKVRNQVRKGRKNGLTVAWGGEDLLGEFYGVFSRNMRDLGTPVYGRGFFRAMLRQFPGRSELCVVRAGSDAVAAAILLHGWGITEVPSASSLRSHNHTNANMLMYWHLLERAIGRGHSTFDFGRSTRGGGTHRFKEQWGATPETAAWRHHLRTGGILDVRPESPGYQRLIRLWKRLPVGVTRLIGPRIVRGIP
jgi:FemAB-related protein (PEP-CTERM system-associated)